MKKCGKAAKPGATGKKGVNSHKTRASKTKKAMKTKRAMKTTKKAGGFKLGQAATLGVETWGHWLQHILLHGRCWLFVVSVISNLLCLRVTECLRLQAIDFDWKAKSVLIGPLKRQPAVRKPLLPNVLKVLCKLRQSGIQKKRTARQGGRGQVQWMDRWVWPKHGHMFPADRPDSKESHRCKNTVSKAILRLRASFTHPADGVIRSHSARHSMVNTLKVSGVPEHIGMFYARIKDPKVYKGYGGMTTQQATDLLRKHKGLGKNLAAHHKVSLGKKK